MRIKNEILRESVHGFIFPLIFQKNNLQKIEVLIFQKENACKLLSPP